MEARPEFTSRRIADYVAGNVRERLDSFIGMKPSPAGFELIGRQVSAFLRKAEDDGLIADWDIPEVKSVHDTKTKWGKAKDWLLWKFTRRVLRPWWWAYYKVFYKEDGTPFQLHEEGFPDIFEKLTDDERFELEVFINMNFVRARKIHREDPYCSLLVNFAIKPNAPLNYILITTHFSRVKE